MRPPASIPALILFLALAAPAPVAAERPLTEVDEQFSIEISREVDRLMSDIVEQQLERQMQRLSAQREGKRSTGASGSRTTCRRRADATLECVVVARRP